MKAILVAGLVAAVALGGCLQSAPPEIMVSHAESSEQTRATVESVPPSGMRYSELMIDVDGKAYAFGEFMSFEERRYQVSGKRDAASAVEQGDMITIPAVGVVMVKVLWKGDSVASYEANIPDTRAPAAPMLIAPADNAEGVSATPTFRWSEVKDPSAVMYVLAYSLDPNLGIPSITTKVEDLSASQHSVPGGKELLAGQAYYWRVQAVDGAGNAGPWSPTFSFTVAGSLLPA